MNQFATKVWYATCIMLSTFSTAKSMDTVPNEVTYMFLEHMNYPQRAAVARVCKVWNFLAHTFPAPKALSPDAVDDFFKIIIGPNPISIRGGANKLDSLAATAKENPDLIAQTVYRHLDTFQDLYKNVSASTQLHTSWYDELRLLDLLLIWSGIYSTPEDCSRRLEIWQTIDEKKDSKQIVCITNLLQRYLNNINASDCPFFNQDSFSLALQRAQANKDEHFCALFYSKLKKTKPSNLYHTISPLHYLVNPKISFPYLAECVAHLCTVLDVNEKGSEWMSLALWNGFDVDEFTGFRIRSAELTPLHIVENPHLLQILLKAGADPKVHNEDGETPKEFMKKQLKELKNSKDELRKTNLKTCIQILKEHAKKNDKNNNNADPTNNKSSKHNCICF